MRKILCILLAVLLLGLCACGTETKEEEPKVTPAPAPTAAPTPEPEPIPVVVVVSDGDDALFVDGISTQLGQSGKEIDLINDGGAFDAQVQSAADADVVIACIFDEDTDVSGLNDLAKNGKPVLAFNIAGAKLDSSIVSYGYDATDAQQMIWETILVMPSHDTPVRLLGVFSSENSEAGQIFANNLEEGKIMNKGRYYDDVAESKLEDWFDSKLDTYYPGMLDAVYCENESYAKAVSDVLLKSGRDDIEIITWYNRVPSDEFITNKYIFYAEVCPNLYYVGSYMTKDALNVLDGGNANPVTFTPDVLYAQGTSYLTENMLSKFPF